MQTISFEFSHPRVEQLPSHITELQRQRPGLPRGNKLKEHISFLDEFRF